MESNKEINVVRIPDSDRAICSAEEDEFGFTEIAQKLTPSLIDATNTDGMVIGIEGKWGSGKTSLLNFLTAELEAKRDGHLHIIKLPPWLQGDANALIGALLSQMKPHLEKEEQQKQPKKSFLGFNKQKATQIGKTLGRYAAKTGRGLSPLLKLGGVFVPGLSMAGEAAKHGGDFLDASLEEPSVSELKKQIVDLLDKSELRFVVLLDDLDRLEPSQMTEVIRLVRSVADFPHVVYCLCYDRQVLTHALEHGLCVENGQAFLQKIVQQTFSMPLPEPFDLRNSLVEKLHDLYEEVNGRPLSDEEAEDLRSIVDKEGNRLQVPRDIPLVLNAVKFSYPQVRHEVYFPDVCWIQLIRAKRPELYLWIEGYLGTRSVITTTSASVSKT